MFIARAYIPNALSLYRVPAAVAFLVVYSAVSRDRYVVALVIAATAIASDVLDGHLARQWNVATKTGYFLDGIGDKSFYVAVLLLMSREHIANDVLLWALIVREILLYALRSLDPQMWTSIAHLRKFSRYHALLLRLFFLCFVVRDGLQIFGAKAVTLFPYANILGYAALVTGYWSIAALISVIASKD